MAVRLGQALLHHLHLKAGVAGNIQFSHTVPVSSRDKKLKIAYHVSRDVYKKTRFLIML